MLATQSSFYTMRHPSSSILTCGQPSHSPDPNLVDYHILSMNEAAVYQVAIRDMDDLRQRLWKHGLNSSTAWWTMRLINGERLEACVHAEGGHSEHSMWHFLPDIQVATHNTGSFQSHQCQTTQSFLFEPPTFATFDQINKFII